MANTYWFKQKADSPLFSDIIWSRPENKLHAGKLLIIGGNLYGFSAPAEAYVVATQSGVGVVRAVLPIAIKKIAGKLIDNVSFAPSTPSGSFSQKALSELLDEAAWADGIIFAGDLGHNSETAILLEKFLTKYSGPVTLVKDTIDYIVTNPLIIQNRDQTTLVLSLSQLQRLITVLKYPQPITFSMPLLRLVDLLHDLTQSYAFNVIVKHQDVIYVAVGGQISTTELPNSSGNWQVSSATKSAVWWLQNPKKPFEALSSFFI